MRRFAQNFNKSTRKASQNTRGFEQDVSWQKTRVDRPMEPGFGANYRRDVATEMENVYASGADRFAQNSQYGGNYNKRFAEKYGVVLDKEMDRGFAQRFSSPGYNNPGQASYKGKPIDVNGKYTQVDNGPVDRPVQKHGYQESERQPQTTTASSKASPGAYGSKIETNQPLSRIQANRDAGAERGMALVAGGTALFGVGAFGYAATNM